MTKINENPNWEDEIHQIDRKERVSGGRNGVANIQARQLANRTGYLRQLLEGIAAGDQPYQSAAEFQKDIDDNKVPLGARVSVRGDGDDTWLSEYQNADGVATPTGVTVKNGKYVDTLATVVKILKECLPEYHQSPDLIALYVDENGNVPAWLNNGAQGFADIEPESAQKVINASASFKALNMAPHLIALFYDEDGNVSVLLDEGKFDAAAVSDHFAHMVGDIIGTGNNVAVRNTSGSSLYLMRAKKGKLRAGVNGRLVGMAVGDSWSEFYNISQALANRMYADWGPRAGAGWFQLITDPSSRWENMIVTRSGWTEYDASYSNAQPPYGCGVDGIAYYTSANNATASITNVRDTAGTVFYHDGTGTFVIGVGNTTKTVVGTGSGEYRSATIPGLTSGLDTVTITTAGNTGVVCLHGFLFETETATGCMMHKCGNGGTWGAQHTNFITPRIKYFAQKLNPDFIVVNLGTNDYLQSRTTSTYVTALNGIIDAWRTMLPDVGIILISPPVPNATGTTPMIDFRNAMRTVARDKNVEWYDLYGDMPTVWATGNAMGWWKDSYHPNDVGAAQIVNSLFDLLLNK
ncbi:SGNH/GDSL hydrolase family protein [Serratia nevei]|uniref:SGNH/GDSL hydrolase family protein n=1 Tax=Serratia nevei TaxID=2703794 RepID=UPI003FA7999F|nr:SGNH/GDSL hydrolase family protein [Serratia marcescens]